MMQPSVQSLLTCTCRSVTQLLLHMDVANFDAPCAAGGLSHSICRCAIHWDDAALRHELMVRPAGVCNNDTWHWSGGFKLTDR